jgi:hypothetical protein
MKRTTRCTHVVFPIVLLAAAATILIVSASLCAQSADSPRPVKKLVEYGWDVPYPDQVRQNIRVMEKKPFDGVIFRLREWNHAFDARPWDEAKLKPQFDDLAATQWKTFTDNFLCIYSANQWKMDWFNDDQWKTITANVRLTGKAARIGHCAGIVFDPEPYGENPWAYPGMNKNRSFAEVEAQVYKRGAQFMTAIQAELPNARLLTFFHQSFFGELLDMADVQERQERLSQNPWGLFSAFWNGALDAASPGVRIIDGYELAYYFNNRDAFFDAYHLMHQRTLALVPPSLRAKHAGTVQAGMSLYVDELLALRQPPEQYVSFYLSPAERQRWFEHNVYYALRTSDEYVWCYSERMNWWENKVPDGAEAAIRSAREKIAKGQPLGFDIADIIAAGNKKMAEATKAAKPKP